MSVLNMKDDATRDLVSAYRRVFNTKDGRMVLKDMLCDLHYHDTLAGQEDVIRHNYAKILLYKLGILTDDNEDRMISALLAIPVSILPEEGIEGAN